MSDWITGPDAASRYGMDQRTIAMAAVAGRIRRVRTNRGRYCPRWTYDAADRAAERAKKEAMERAERDARWRARWQ